MRLLRFGLRAQIILNLIVLMVFTIVLISMATLKITASGIMKQKSMSGNILVNSIQSSLDSIFRGDPDSFQNGKETWRLKRLVYSLSREKGFKTLFIVDRTHRVLAHSDEGMKDAVFRDQDMDRAMSTGETITKFGKGDRWFYWGVSDELSIFAPIRLGSQIVGGIRANLSLSDVQESIIKTQKIIFLYIVFDSIIIIVLGGFLLSRSVVRPIKRLLEATDKMGGGDFRQRMQGGGVNEISKLFMSFNRMSNRLEEHLNSLETANVELKQTRDEVIRSEKLASVGRLAAGVAHEIGNPIGAILGYVYILKEGTTSKEEEKDYLKRIEAESNRINTIMRNLLDFSRPSNMNVERADINKIIENTISLVSPQKIFQNVELVLELGDDIPHAFVDENQFQQVIINLAINATDAMPEGGKITIRTGELLSPLGKHLYPGTLPTRRKDDPPDSDYSYLREGYNHDSLSEISTRATRCVSVEISDTGSGMKTGDIPKIFDPFFTTKPPGKGTGLGLATCLRIIESFRGEIRVKSTEGEGSCFTILLPVDEA